MTAVMKQCVDNLQSCKGCMHVQCIAIHVLLSRVNGHDEEIAIMFVLA